MGLFGILLGLGLLVWLAYRGWTILLLAPGAALVAAAFAGGPMAVIVGPIIAFAAVIALGSAFGSF
jgi:hypothetical protein